MVDKETFISTALCPTQNPLVICETAMQKIYRPLGLWLQARFNFGGMKEKNNTGKTLMKPTREKIQY